MSESPGKNSGSRPARPITPHARHKPPVRLKPPEPASAAVPAKPTSYAPPTKRSAKRRSGDELYAQRTLIPILLTTGVLFCGIGAGQWMSDADYPFSARNIMWSAVALPVAGGVLLLLAGVNMAYVRRKMGSGAK